MQEVNRTYYILYDLLEEFKKRPLGGPRLKLVGCHVGLFCLQRTLYSVTNWDQSVRWIKMKNMMASNVTQLLVRFAVFLHTVNHAEILLCGHQT